MLVLDISSGERIPLLAARYTIIIKVILFPCRTKPSVDMMTQTTQFRIRANTPNREMFPIIVKSEHLNTNLGLN